MPSLAVVAAPVVDLSLLQLWLAVLLVLLEARQSCAAYGTFFWGFTILGISWGYIVIMVIYKLILVGGFNHLEK
jgi:hypothetical protein